MFSRSDKLSKTTNNCRSKPKAFKIQDSSEWAIDIWLFPLRSEQFKNKSLEFADEERAKFFPYQIFHHRESPASVNKHRHVNSSCHIYTTHISQCLPTTRSWVTFDDVFILYQDFSDSNKQSFLEENFLCPLETSRWFFSERSSQGFSSLFTLSHRLRPALSYEISNSRKWNVRDFNF